MCLGRIFNFPLLVETFRLARRVAIFLTVFCVTSSDEVAWANQPGGGNGTGPDVTAKNNPDGTITLDNGIATLVINPVSASVASLLYTHTQNGTARQDYVMEPHSAGFYFNTYTGNGKYTHDPAKDHLSPDQADVVLKSDATGTKGIMEVHYSLLRGSPGFYATVVLIHTPADGAIPHAPFGATSLVAPIFNWASVDSARSYFIGTETSGFVEAADEAKEIGINKSGTQVGQFADKFLGGQDHGDLTAWGWSSVGPKGANIGAWLMTNLEFSDGGPLKRDVTAFPFTNRRYLNNSLLTTEIGQGDDGGFYPGETGIWTKVCGPFFFYVNSTTDTTSASHTAQALYQDALAQARAEASAWPYKWFSEPNYVQASDRGTVTGKIEVNDTGHPQPSLGGMWIGLEAQPFTSTKTYDFQQWVRPYQFWTRTDQDGNFTLPNVIPGTNYTLYAFGPGASGTFMSQKQEGGDPPWTYSLPAKPFAVTVSKGITTNLGTITWNVPRVGATVFELGYPNRKTDKFRHGEDFWAPELTNVPGFPTPIWGGQARFVTEFPHGLIYTVGQSKWSTDWNYVIPSVPDAMGKFQPISSEIDFNLATSPNPQAKASIYLAVAGSDGAIKGRSEDHLMVTLNGSSVGSGEGVTAMPSPTDESGIIPAYSDNSSNHISNHGPFWDETITFPASLLHSGKNALVLSMPLKSNGRFLMVDYLRLELNGFVPPPPSSVTVYPGLNSVLVTWPVVAGAVQYNILRSAAPTGPFTLLASKKLGPVCGSDSSISTYVDASAVNGTTYYYQVESENLEGGKSAGSPASNAVTPVAEAALAPTTPNRLHVDKIGDQMVSLSWEPSPGANYYSVSRTTRYPDGTLGTDGTTPNYYDLRTIVLNDCVLTPSFIDKTPSNGTMYSYTVQAFNVAGASSPTAPIPAMPLPAVPAEAPADLTAVRTGTTITLQWKAVPGALGYVIYRSTSASGPFNFPDNFVITTPELTYMDSKLSDSTPYFYQVTAVNAAGISPMANVKVP